MVEEGKIGSNYVVNVKVKTDLSKSVISDNLSDTVDYVSLYSIVKEEMNQRVKLLEVVVQRIIDRIFEKHKSVESVWINVAKINPPIGGEVDEVSVERKGKRKKE